MSLSQKYDHQLVENDKNSKWIAKRYFSSHDQTKTPFAIILPPPNVTGRLHLGHAWDSYIQDTLIRYHKLNGFDVMFVPGLDHAGIATQAKVEATLLAEKNQTRHDLGREAFLKLVWTWKETYAAAIREQWGTLGLALDYEHERFTMDQGLSEAVSKVFIDWHRAGLIYRGERPVNWDPQLQTVLSNIEVEAKATSSIMYYIAYPLSKGGFINIATVRPETMYSDVAIAVHPSDKRFETLVGQTAISPLTKRELIIVSDESIELNKGTGAMKVSAHAEEDFRIIKKHHLVLNEAIDKQGKMTSLAGDLSGVDRFVARKLVVQKLGQAIYKEEKITNNVGYSQRSNAVVEVLVQPQWFVKMAPLAQLILTNLHGANPVKFFPTRFSKQLLSWLENIEDWCISRQLWWGHQIPAWHRNEEVKVQLDSPGADWVRDPDVLDTWFSSGLAPFSFLGWPNDLALFKRYYPTSVLVTGYDIIFFWVARMYFASLNFTQQKPFERVLIHGLIRGADGRKMSKSLNNGVDPMDVIKNYGSDALRYFLLTNSTPGQDIRYDVVKVEASWNLCNKLWNIARYIIDLPEAQNEVELSPADIWIHNRLVTLHKALKKHLNTYNFTIIGKEINAFLVDDLSGWYLELSKAVPNARFIKNLLQSLLIMLHPFLPFITDHLHLALTNDELLTQSWPTLRRKRENAASINVVIAAVKALREFRATNQISFKTSVEYEAGFAIEEASILMINRLANAQTTKTRDSVLTTPFGTLYVRVNDELLQAENNRLTKEVLRLESEVKRAQNILNNKAFLAKAPAAQIDSAKDKLAQYQSQLTTLQAKLKAKRNKL